MTSEEFLAALALPADAAVDKRVPKSVLAEHAAATAADRRVIADGVDTVRWVASLKPSNCGVPAYRDAEREYLEIVCLRVQLREGAKGERLRTIIHRSIPYPAILLSEGSVTMWSMAHKRNSHAGGQGMVLDDDPEAVDISAVDFGRAAAIAEACAMTRLPRTDMRVLYEAWQGALTALRASEFTGTFVVSRDTDSGASRRAALRTVATIDAEIARLRTAAAREGQTARLVDLNLQLTRLRAERAATVERL